MLSRSEKLELARAEKIIAEAKAEAYARLEAEKAAAEAARAAARAANPAKEALSDKLVALGGRRIKDDVVFSGETAAALLGYKIEYLPNGRIKSATTAKGTTMSTYEVLRLLYSLDFSLVNLSSQAIDSDNRCFRNYLAAQMAR